MTLIYYLCQNSAFLGQERQYYGIVDTKTPICVLYGVSDDAPLLALQSSYTTLQLISNGQIVDLQTVINIPLTALEENRFCIYFRFEEITTYEITATLQCNDHNVRFPLIFNSISASNYDLLHSLHDVSSSMLMYNVSKLIFVSSEIHKFKETVLFQFDFGDGVVSIDESQSGKIGARHNYLEPGIFEITWTAIFENHALRTIGCIHRFKVNITNNEDDESYLDNEEITYKREYDEISSDNQSKRQTSTSIKRRSTEPGDLRFNETIQFDSDNNFTVTMYNSVNMTRNQVQSIASDSSPFRLNMTAAPSKVDGDTLFIIKCDLACPLLSCNFDFGDGTNGTFQRVTNGSSVRHRYTKTGHYKVTGMLKIHLLRW